MESVVAEITLLEGYDQRHENFELVYAQFNLI